MTQTPSARRREGRHAYYQDGNPDDLNPYLRSKAWGADMKAGDWQDGWREAAKADRAQAEIDDNLVPTVEIEALRERLTDVESFHDDAENRAEAAEARAVELAGALGACEREMSEAYRLGLVDSLAPKAEASSFTQAVSLARTALSAMPAEALERAKAKDEVVDQADEVYTRLLVLKLVGKFIPPDDAVAHEFHELGRRLTKLDALTPAKETTP